MNVRYKQSIDKVDRCETIAHVGVIALINPFRLDFFLD